ncbi:MAG: nuclear transport factor 2 family protein [Armatimonadota bacterium]
MASKRQVGRQPAKVGVHNSSLMDAQACPQPTSAEMRELEEILLNPTIRASSEALQGLLTDEFREFGASGRTYDKHQVIADLVQQPEELFTIEDFRLQQLGPGFVLVTYRAIRHHNPSNKAPFSLRSSIWRSNLGRWQMVFHQGTPSDYSANSTS